MVRSIKVAPPLVVAAPGSDGVAGVHQAEAQAPVAALVTEPSPEALGGPVLAQLAHCDGTQPCCAPVEPLIERLPCDLRLLVLGEVDR